MKNLGRDGLKNYNKMRTRIGMVKLYGGMSVPCMYAANI